MTNKERIQTIRPGHDYAIFYDAFKVVPSERAAEFGNHPTWKKPTKHRK